MKMCNKCWNKTCTECDEIMAYMNYYIKDMWAETGIDYGDALEVVQEWVMKKIDEYNELSNVERRKLNEQNTLEEIQQP